MFISSRGKQSAGWVLSISFALTALVFPLECLRRASAQGQGGTVATVSAASFLPDAPVGPGSIAAGFGKGLATSSDSAPGVPLPTSLAGTVVRVNGEAAPLFFVSPGQVNYVIPPGTPSGIASVMVTSGDGTVSTGTVQIAPVAPGLFTASATGSGPLAAQLLRVKSDGQQITEPVTDPTGMLVPVTIDATDQAAFLVLYLTGVRQAPKDDVRVVIGGAEFTPSFVGAQGSFEGLDQINVELPRDFDGRGQISVLVKAAGYSASNTGQFALLKSETGQLRIAELSDAVLAGTRMVIVKGSGFAPTPEANILRVVADTGDQTAKADVTAVRDSGSVLEMTVPFGSATGLLTVSSQGHEASAPIKVRTSISGHVDNGQLQPDGKRAGIKGMRVQLRGQPGFSALTDENGSWVLADVPPGNQEVEINPVQGALPFPSQPLKLEVRAGRDNLSQRQELKSNSVSFSSSSRENSAGATSVGPLTLTFLDPGRTPTDLPARRFSTHIAQLTPFSTPADAGTKLTFPNDDGLAAGSSVDLFKFDLTTGSATLGEFIQIGSATVTADRQSIETAPGAVNEGSYYFVSNERQTGVINGRVLENSGRPVPLAGVQLRGQSTLTDGFGGFVLRDVPILKTPGDRVKVEVSYLRPDATVSRKDGAEVELRPNNLVTVTPDIVLDPVQRIVPPVLLAPMSLTLTAGDTRDFDFVAISGDGKPAQVGFSGTATAFATLSNQSGGAYRLHLSPGAHAEGDYTLNLTATDAGGLQSTQTVAVKVNPSGNTKPLAHSQSVTTPEDTPIPITLTGVDPGGRPLTYTIVNVPTRGSLSGLIPNLTYTPATNYNGVDSFTFKASSGGADSTPATCFIAIIPVNDRPELKITGSTAVNAGQTLSLVVSATDVDGDQPLTFRASGLPPGSNFLAVSGTSMQLIWSPILADAGTYAVSFTVTDPGGLSATAKVNVDVGAKWAKTSGPDGGEVHTIVNVAGTLYAGTQGSGVFRSTDNGRSWVEVSDGLIGQALFVYDLLSSGSNLYAATADGLYISSNGGQHWTPRPVGAHVIATALFETGGRLFVGTDGDGVFVSADGLSWTVSNQGLSAAAKQVRAFGTNGTQIYLASYGGGVNTSTNLGQSWAEINNQLGDPYVQSLLVTGNSLYAGTYSKGIYLSTNNGQSWNAMNKGFPTSSIQINALLAIGDTLYAGTSGSGIYSSIDGGQNWSATNNGFSGTAIFVNELVAVGMNLFAGTREGVSRSDDAGRHWTRSNSGLVTSHVQALLNDADGLLAGTSAGIFRSTDSGASWNPSSNGLPDQAFDIRALEQDAGKIYAGTDGGGVYRSDDKGESWAAAGNGLVGAGMSIRSLEAAFGELYAGTNGAGVFSSSDAGQHWVPASNGLPDKSIVFALLASGTKLYAAVFNHGVYRSTDGGLNWVPANNGMSGAGLQGLALIFAVNALYWGGLDSRQRRLGG
jgi:uncharacterized protein (TIGR03437 family)